MLPADRLELPVSPAGLVSETGTFLRLFDFAKAQIEIAEYKKHQLSKIDQSMNDVLLKVSGSILGKVIPIRDHQQLIIDALEQAKKEGMFQI